ncbi:hypothetical protein ABBQ38_000726 [Trebouxia sp. C0009 RCD-2024]
MIVDNRHLSSVMEPTNLEKLLLLESRPAQRLQARSTRPSGSRMFNEKTTAVHKRTFAASSFGQGAFVKYSIQNPGLPILLVPFRRTTFLKMTASGRAAWKMVLLTPAMLQRTRR